MTTEKHTSKKKTYMQQDIETMLEEGTALQISNVRLLAMMIGLAKAHGNYDVETLPKKFLEMLAFEQTVFAMRKKTKTQNYVLIPYCKEAPEQESEPEQPKQTKHNTNKTTSKPICKS
jgi:hypothetical protein